MLCYGFVGPLASHMAKLNDAETHYYHVLRVALISYIRGSAPILAVEFARRAIPSHVRPSFKETESACRGGRASTPAPAEPPAVPPAEAASAYGPTRQP